MIGMLCVWFLLAQAFAWTATWLLIRFAPSLGLIDRPDPRKVHKRPVPLGGGVAIVAAVVLTTFFLGTPGGTLPPQWWWWPGLILFALGLVDDLRPLPWQVRLAAHFGVGALAVFTALPVEDWLLGGLAVLWVVTFVNACNMLDNMDALSGGTVWVACGGLTALLALAGRTPEVTPFVSVMGALAGFLMFNWPPARIFMGDAGSTFLGLFLGTGSLLVAAPQGWAAWLAVVCICAVPLYDLVSVVSVRLSQGRSPFHADKQHLSHRLVARGFSPPVAVMLIHLLALASGVAGVVTYALDAWWPAAVALVGWAALAFFEVGNRSQRSEVRGPS